MVPVVFEAVGQLLGSPAWQHRHAAMLAISAVGDVMPNNPQQRELVVDRTLPLLRDPHPRVRYAALHLLGYLGTSMRPDLQVQLHGKVLPALLSAVGEPVGQRVQSHAVSALANFIDGCPAEALEPYTDAVLGALMALLRTPHLVMLEEVGRQAPSSTAAT